MYIYGLSSPALLPLSVPEKFALVGECVIHGIPS